MGKVSKTPPLTYRMGNKHVTKAKHEKDHESNIQDNLVPETH